MKNKYLLMKMFCVFLAGMVVLGGCSKKSDNSESGNSIEATSKAVDENADNNSEKTEDTEEETQEKFVESKMKIQEQVVYQDDELIITAKEGVCSSVNGEGVRLEIENLTDEYKWAMGRSIYINDCLLYQNATSTEEKTIFYLDPKEKQERIVYFDKTLYFDNGIFEYELVGKIEIPIEIATQVPLEDGHLKISKRQEVEMLIKTQEYDNLGKNKFEFEKEFESGKFEEVYDMRIKTYIKYPDNDTDIGKRILVYGENVSEREICLQMGTTEITDVEVRDEDYYNGFPITFIEKDGKYYGDEKIYLLPNKKMIVDMSYLITENRDYGVGFFYNYSDSGFTPCGHTFIEWFN